MYNRYFTGLALLALLLFASHAIADSAEKISTLADQKEVAVTIYNENLALDNIQRKPGPGERQKNTYPGKR
jgi:mRNA degradation ribonuclease J1/J2